MKINVTMSLCAKNELNFEICIKTGVLPATEVVEYHVPAHTVTARVEWRDVKAGGALEEYKEFSRAIVHLHEVGQVEEQAKCCAHTKRHFCRLIGAQGAWVTVANTD